MTFVVRTAGDPAVLTPAVKSAIREVRPGLPFSQIATVEHFLSESLRPRRFSLFLVGSFAAMAFILAAVGLYGLMSYMTNSRRAEIGLRMALGARRSDVIKLVVRQGMTLTATGLLLGLAMAAATSHLLSSMLFEVHANDPASYGVVSVLMALVSLVACLVPAFRATSADLMGSLRHE